MALCASAPAQEPLKNDSIVELTKSGIDEATVLRLIESRPSSFDTSVAALLRLKQAGVTDRVIDAMVSAGNSKEAVSSGLFDVPDEVGVYANVREQLVPLKIEIVTWRTGGELKRLYGNRGHLNGVVSRPLSTRQLDSRPEFIILVADGVAAEEYLLIRFWKKDDRREFRIVTGGVFHATSGPEDNLVPVDIERVGPRTYRVRPAVALQHGEYGFLAPAASTTASVASSGKIYTFRVDEER
jgi:hypothetical protein